METIENRFALKLLKKATDDDYAVALRIYSNETPLDIRTNTNEFTYWLNKSNVTTPFDLLMFCLFLDGNIVGFSQLAYLKKTKVIILDYITLKEPYRLNSVFLVFFSMLQNYISQENIEVAFYVAEISNKNDGKDIDRESAFYKRIVCLEGFGQVDCKYYNFPLGLNNHESCFDSLMFIKSVDVVKSITRETFLAIVYSICFEYYLVWYSEFLSPDEIDEYRTKLETYYKSIEKQCPNCNDVAVKYPACPLFSSNNFNKTSGIIPAKKMQTTAGISLLAFLVFIAPVILIGLYTYILPLINVQFSATSTFVGTVIAALVSSISAYVLTKRKSK